jgi:AcrR family transcriptional regulator
MSESNTLVAPEPLAARGRIDKRAAILDAAYRVFAREGYERASIDEIAADAGVAKPTIYNHFGAKEELFRQVVLDSALYTNANTLNAIESIPMRPADLSGELERVGEKLVGCLQDGRAMTLQRLLWSEIYHFPDLWDVVQDQAARPIVEALAGRLAILANAGYLDVPDPMRAAAQFITLTGEELKNKSAYGTKPIPEDIWRESIAAGVDTFLRAFERR